MGKTSLLLTWPILFALAPGVAPASPPEVAGMARAAGLCRADQLCLFRNPEDLVDLAGTPWLLIGQHDPARPEVGISALNTRTGRIVALQPAPDTPACIPDARGGGIGVRREGKGYRLVRILHEGSYVEASANPTAEDAVETYRVIVDRNGPRLVRTACVKAPLPLFLNDVAPLPGGGFVATHMFDRSAPAATRTARNLAGQATGHVVRWSSTAGWQKIAGSDGAFPNGIDASQDGRTIAFAETYGHSLTLIRPDGSGRRVVKLAMNPDNVVWAGGSRFIVAGGTGVPFKSTAGCAAYRLQGCAFPAAAVRVEGATGGVTPLAASEGGELPGFSVALLKAGRLYIGSSSGDRITILDQRTLPASLP